MSIAPDLIKSPSISVADEDLRHSLRNPGEAGSIHSWELVTSVDGPGSRLTIFLAGCPLRCLYCHNPDTWQMRRGERHTLDDVMAKVRRYAPVLQATGGGVTLSGGEPLLQAQFVESIFAECKKLGIHTALDTSGFLGGRATNQLLNDTDLVLLDVKSGLPDVYRKATGRPLQPTLDFGRRLSAQGKKIWARFVLVPGLTDGEDNVEAVADYLASLDTVERVEVLPFHQMGKDKWAELDEAYALADTKPPSDELQERVRAQFARRGLTVF
ncbi:pyruvate formate-lyase-activating protein [Demequina aurantiaca]|uniref:pyruvate formate-lyase-activating protein n=1 Tax=Demequina aurantiaca TaxID=676200 RepID=UPI000783FE08|nr:pyruvate formate-lyase-activating protein [Demequina aurantiaca]